MIYVDADGNLRREREVTAGLALKELLSGIGSGSFRLKVQDGGFAAQSKVDDSADPWHSIVGVVSDSDVVQTLDQTGEA